MARSRRLALAVTFALLVAACGREPDSASSDRIVASPEASASVRPSKTKKPNATASALPSTSSPTTVTEVPPRDTPPDDPVLAQARVKLTRVVSMDAPIAMALRKGDSNLYVAEKGGRVKAVRGGSVGSTVLDISSQVSTGGEQGLLGLAFSPDGKRMYVNFTNGPGDTVVREYAFTSGRATSPRDVIVIDQPYANHNGGNIVFGPDGYLYIGMGDGGSAGDPQNNAQNLDSLLGKMLRINPVGSGQGDYSSPSSNPFVGRSGHDAIWAYGLRNPWRFSFDRSTKALWIADVGQGAWEEVNAASGGSDGGENYGWRRMEGKHPYGGGTAPSNHHAPVYEYSHDDGNCSVTGGYVYRGSKIPDLYGAYLFADFCAGRLRAFVAKNGSATGHRFLGPQVGNFASFGQDRNGELYVLSLEGGFYRIDPA
jgi:glucose/arabinose dehydrogenase